MLVAHGTFRTPTRMQMDNSKLHGMFDGGAEADDNVDEEAGGNDEDEGGEGAGFDGGQSASGPLPGTVETRHRKNEEYMSRRARLQNKYPNLQMQ